MGGAVIQKLFTPKEPTYLKASIVLRVEYGSVHAASGKTQGSPSVDDKTSKGSPNVGGV